MKQTTLIAVAVTLAGGMGYGLSAVAQHGDGGPGGRHGHGAEFLKSIDTNEDGSISRDEAMARQAQMFERADADADGLVTLDEMSAFREAEREERRRRRREAGFSELDANGDGAVSADEFADRAAPLFDRLDANGDDIISAEEIENAGPPHGGRRRGRKG